MEITQTATLSTCPHCRGPIPQRSGSGRPRTYCSKECRKAFRTAAGVFTRARRKYRHTERGRAANRERQQKLRRRFGEARPSQCEPGYDRRKIFDRDRWRCRMCLKAVQDTRQEAKNSATVRLIVPRSRGGRHTTANCETACRECAGRAAIVERERQKAEGTLPTGAGNV